MTLAVRVSMNLSELGVTLASAVIIGAILGAVLAIWIRRD